MKPEIKVVLVPPTPYGRLHPRYYDDANMLVAEAELPQDNWPNGITIDMLVVCDADATGRVINIDIMAAKSGWEVSELPGRPAKQLVADLQLAESTLAHRFFTEEVDVLTNPGRTRVLVNFAPRTDAAIGVVLSDRALAIVEHNQLVALDIDLS